MSVKEVDGGHEAGSTIKSFGETVAAPVSLILVKVD